MTKPLITIITVVYNGEKYLEQTIKSVVNQTYDNIEYIVIDGGSTDGTLNIIKKYEDKIAYWISEPDKGISDAFNKGVKVSKGDYINFQGDGDGFINNTVISTIFKDEYHQKNTLISARIRRVDENGVKLYDSKLMESFNKSSLLYRMSLPHQGLFTHRRYFEEFGLFDVNNKFCMDYEHLLRSYHNFPKTTLKDEVVAQWRADGLGNGKTLEIYREYDKIKRDNKVANNFTLSLVKYFILLKYFLKGLIIGETS